MSTLQARRLLDRHINLPTLPSVMQKLSALLEDPDAGARDIGQLVSEDVALTAKVLKIANSAYYGLRERCLAPQQAASILGMKVLRNVVMQAAVMKQYDHLKNGVFDVDGLWRHSILTAHCCQYLGRKCHNSIGLAPDELYICGLLHDLGQVVLLDALGDEYLKVVTLARDGALKLHDAEEQSLGFTHADVGALLAQQWSLPDSIHRAIQFHHAGSGESEEDPIVLLVRHTNLFAHAVTEHTADPLSHFDADLRQFLGVEESDLAEMASFAEQALASIVL
ncbi:MAG: HDOD domain-containing protein [Planctomycetes bacterium]|nr:HDOD domain-containing protein [Planctomycetota bacterium]